MPDNSKQLNTDLTTFNESSSKRTPIQTALTRPLVSAVGKCFLLLSGTTEEVTTDNEQAIPRAVYQVRVISNKTIHNTGTVLTVKVKGHSSIIDDSENQKLLLGTEHKVVAFDDLSHWNFNGSEGLSASNIRILDIEPQEAMKL